MSQFCVGIIQRANRREVTRYVVLVSLAITLYNPLTFYLNSLSHLGQFGFLSPVIAPHALVCEFAVLAPQFLEVHVSLLIYLQEYVAVIVIMLSPFLKI